MAQADGGQEVNLASYRNRERGILTEDDRDYLLGEKEYANENNKYQKRHRIRNRIRNSLLDFILLSTGTGAELFRDVLNDLKTPNGESWTVMNEDWSLADDQLVDALYALQYSLFQGLFLQDREADDPFHPKVDLFEQMVTEGPAEYHRRLAYQEQNKFVDIYHNFEYRILGSMSVDELIKRYEDGTLLSIEALWFLIEHTDISLDEVNKYWGDLDLREKQIAVIINQFPWIPTLRRPDEVDLDELFELLPLPPDSKERFSVDLEDEAEVIGFNWDFEENYNPFSTEDDIEP